MKIERDAPVEVSITPTDIETKPLALTGDNGFDAHGGTTKPQTIIVCHRCRKLKLKRGSISASIENECGEHVRHYLCAACCNQLRRGHQR